VLSRDSRQEKKAKAFLRAQFRLKQQFEYIDFCEDTLIPAIEAMKSGKEVPVLGLPAGAAFDLQVVDDAATAQNEAGDTAKS
jgi:hypothetical protein